MAGGKRGRGTVARGDEIAPNMARNEISSGFEQRAQRDEAQAYNIVHISLRKYLQRGRAALEPILISTLQVKQPNRPLSTGVVTLLLFFKVTQEKTACCFNLRPEWDL